MTSRDARIPHTHGPENAEHEIKKAYDCAIEAGVVHFWERKAIPGVNPYEVVTFYKRAMDAYQAGDRLAAERWARAAKHLSRAYWHEAKISYLEPRLRELPFLENAAAEYNPGQESAAEAAQLLDAAEKLPSAGLESIASEMKSYVTRGRRQLSLLREGEEEHELLRVERVQSAHEYARVVECLSLVSEAGSRGKGAAA